MGNNDSEPNSSSDFVLRVFFQAINAEVLQEYRVSAEKNRSSVACRIARDGGEVVLTHYSQQELYITVRANNGRKTKIQLCRVRLNVGQRTLRSIEYTEHKAVGIASSKMALTAFSFILKSHAWIEAGLESANSKSAKDVRDLLKRAA